MRLILTYSFICFSFFILKSQTLSAVSLPKEITQHNFNYKGFAMNLSDDVADEKGDHLLVGEIHAIEKEQEKRDTVINRLFGLKGVVYDDKMGIFITTDKNYKIKQIARSFIGEKIIYDQTKKQFTIGALFFDYLKVGEKSFSAWQPVIIKTTIELKMQVYFVQRPYSCILKNIFIEKDKIKIFTRSNINNANNKGDEKAEIITVSTTKTHKDSARFWINVLDIISILQTPYNDAGRMTISEVSRTENNYYFSTSNLDQFKLKTADHLYRLSKDKLSEVRYFPDLLKLSHDYSEWININGFFVTPQKEYLSLSHIGADKRYILFTKTDTSFNAMLTKKIPLNDYADFDKMLLLPNGNVLIASVNKTKEWSYFLYDTNMQLIKEINSKVSKDYYPQNLKTISNNTFECMFYIDNVNKKDCLLQIVSLN